MSLSSRVIIGQTEPRVSAVAEKACLDCCDSLEHPHQPSAGRDLTFKNSPAKKLPWSDKAVMDICWFDLSLILIEV